MSYRRLFDILNHQCFPVNLTSDLNAIFYRQNEDVLRAIDCFNYGFIEGKRAERAERARRRKLKLVENQKQKEIAVKGGDVA